MPRTTEQFRELRKASTARIMNSALELFAAKGYGQVSVSEIARKAGISQGLMYNYFKSKDDLLSAIIDAMMNEMTELSGLEKNNRKPAEQLELVIVSFFKTMRDRAEFWSMILPLATQKTGPAKLKKALGLFFDETNGRLEQIFKVLGVNDPKEEAMKLGAILDGIAWHHLYIFPGTYPLKKMEKKLLKDYGRF